MSDEYNNGVLAFYFKYFNYKSIGTSILLIQIG